MCCNSFAVYRKGGKKFGVLEQATGGVCVVPKLTTYALEAPSTFKDIYLKMQDLISSKEYYTSMVGVGLLADILPDLPLPTQLPTPLESMVMGIGDMKNDTRRILANGDPSLCSQVTKALQSVDTSFLKLKVAPPNQEYRPDITSPVLIKALLNNGFPHPRVKLKKIDLNQFGGSHASPTLFSPRHSSSDTTILSSFTPPHIPNTDASLLHTSPDRKRDSSSSSSIKEKRSRPLDRKKRHSTSKDHKLDSMMVSINREALSSLGSGKKRRGSLASKRRRISSSAESEHDGEFKLPVRISREKLPSSLKKAPPTHSLNPGMEHSMDTIESVRVEFSLAPGVQDQTVPEGERIKKKKKKKHRHHIQMDQIHKAHVERYNSILEAILDQADQDSLLHRSVIAQLLSETAQLKQMKALHHVSADLLVKVISVMDHHVLDTAALLISDVPDEVDVKAWREISRERVLRSLDAGLVTLHIVTAPNMPNHVHVEESIDQLISHTKYQLENNIYPEFDPVYRAESKESGVLPKQKRRYTSSVNKDIIAMYNRLVIVMETLATLVETQALTDITVLKLSSLGIFPFFVENISTLQLSSLKLVRTIFSRYEKHRDLIFEDIFASLARLPTTKKNLRSFRLSNGQNIQMVTALILQLVQCMVVPFNEQGGGETMPPDNDKSKVALDVAVINSYELSLRTGSNFLSTFMRKCCSGKEEDDFRPLFDNFVQDLLSTLGLPEWPASEVLLTLLGVLLVQTFSNRNNEQQLRLTSLEHLGVIAARLRKDAVSSVREDHEQLVNILAEVLQSKLDNTSPLPSPTGLQRMDAFSENARHLQKTLIAFLSHNSLADPSYAYARNFYLGQWLRDNQVELERGLQQCSPSHSTLSDDEDDVTTRTTIDPSVQLVQQAELTKDFLLGLAKPMASTIMSPLAAVLDDKKAVLVTRYLASSRVLSKSFDMYLQKLLRVLNESAVHVRTRAMKALSTIVAADPTILSRSEVQKAVHYRFSDSSTLMREAAVDLIGRFVLIQPDLTATYYQMLLERILDTGVSVRKRVIKILKDICINQPDFDKITDICIKMIRRINDEEGIKQVVTNVFHQLWFAKPVIDHKQQISQRVTHITEVVAASPNEQECFEHLLEELLKEGNESVSAHPIMEVCQMMVDCLVERVLSLDEAPDHQRSAKQLVNCITTLYLFSKSKPAFLIHHAKTLQPYLSSKCTSQEDNFIVHYIARILETVVPLMERPSESFLASLEEDLVKLIMKQGAMIVQSCVGCLAQVVNKVTKNYKLVKDCYLKFFSYLEKVKILYSQDPNSPQLAAVKPSVLRSTFTVGLFCKHFDINSVMSEVKGQLMNEKVYSLLLSFCRHSDDEVKIKALIGFGFLCVNYPESMLEVDAKDLYLSWLAKDAPLKMKLQVMKNLQTHLVEVESTLKQADANRQKEGGEESLMVLGDRHSSVTSNIAQLYLPSIQETFYTTESKIRLCVVQSMLLILRQGLVHPGQSVGHLIAMSTDPEQDIRVKADLQLSEYSSRFGGFMQTQLVTGLKKAYEFQLMIADCAPRGSLDQSGSGSSSLLTHLYTLVRSSKPQRRAFLRAFLKPFEDFDQTPLGMLLFLADNLSSFPYTVIEEPLFVIHHIDMTLSVTGSSVLQSFRESLGKSGTAAADDEEDDVEKLSQETESFNLNQLNECCRSSLGCVLLLLLKQNLKQSYTLSDKKCQEYTPSTTNKMWEKAVSRRPSIYNPGEVVEEVERERAGNRRINTKEDCIKLYIHFKKLMNRLDPFEGEEDDEEAAGGVLGTVLHSAIPLPPPPEQQTTGKVTTNESPPELPPTTRRGRSRSRASSVSSTASSGSRGGRGKNRRKSSNEDSEPHLPVVKRKRYNILDSDDSDYD